MNRSERRAARSDNRRGGLHRGLPGRIVKSLRAWSRTGEIELPFEDPGFDDALQEALDGLVQEAGDDFPGFMTDLLEEAGTSTYVGPLDGERTELVSTFVFLPVVGPISAIEELVRGPRLVEIEAVLRNGGRGDDGEIRFLPRSFDPVDVCGILPGALRRASGILANASAEGDGDRIAKARLEAAEVLVPGDREAKRDEGAIVLGPRMLIGTRTSAWSQVSMEFDEDAYLAGLEDLEKKFASILPDMNVAVPACDMVEAQGVLMARWVHLSLSLQAEADGKDASNLRVAAGPEEAGDPVVLFGTVEGRLVGSVELPTALLGFDPEEFFLEMDSLVGGIGLLTGEESVGNPLPN